MGKVLAVAALALVASSRAAAPQVSGTLTVSAVRFYSPGGATTTIEGVCEIRLGALLAGGGPRQAARYRVEVAVFDSTGLELQNSGWTREVPAAGRGRNATALESFSFSAASGRYRVRVRAAPEGGAAVEQAIEVRAYQSSPPPPASDLLLAFAARRLAADSDALAPGEVRRAGLAMRTAPAPRLSPLEPALVYYAELYPWTGQVMRGELRVQVVASGGRVVVETPARPVEVAAAGGISRGSLDLTGLPEGDYRLRLLVRLGDSAVVAEAPFAMGSMAAALAAQPAAPAAEARAEDLILEGADEPRLDSLYAPLIYLLEPAERGVYGNLSPEGKRRFLREFWRRRDQTPQTADNPAMTDYYRGVAYANERFRERGVAEVPGWRTDRGRIYLKYGRPDEVFERLRASPRPYEVWKYTRERQRNYVFYDQSGFGNYYLLATDDRLEQGLRSWDQFVRAPGPFLNAEEVRAAFNFMGIALTRVETSP